MDRLVSAKYYRVTDRDEGGLSFAEQIIDFADRFPRALDREFQAASGHLLRLESDQREGDFLSGNFCRIQTENIPPEVTDDGLLPVRLANGRGLGHQNAFLYHRPTRILLWQQNRLGISFNDLALYLNKDVDFASFFLFQPIPGSEAWDKFNASSPRKITVRFAGENRFPEPENGRVPVMVQAKDIAARYNGLEVEITISVGRSRNEFLSKHNIADSIRRLLLRTDVAKMEVHTDAGREEKIIDFIDEQMENKRELDLPSDDPGRNYLIRKNFLRESFNERAEEILARYRQ